MRFRSSAMKWPAAAALGVVAIGGTPAAAPAQNAAARGPSSVLQIATNRGQLITLSRPMSDLFVANPEIADVQVRSPTQLYVFAKKPGETTISATAKGGAVVYASTVRVGNNFDSLSQMLSLAMPEAAVTATTMNGIILLTGTVANPEDGAEAERLVQAFVGEEAQDIRAGDTVWIPPGEKHWHGAGPTTRMAHIAIQEALNGSPVEWMEKVTDEQYQITP